MTKYKHHLEPEIIGEFITLRLKGYSKNQIQTALADKGFTDYEYYKYHAEAGERIRYIQENEVLDTRVLHAQRYEFLYEWFLENDFDDYAMKMLEAIEKLLGIHANTIGLSIHNLVQGKEQKVSLYKIENLTDKEYSRLKELVDKCTND